MKSHALGHASDMIAMPIEEERGTAGHQNFLDPADGLLGPLDDQGKALLRHAPRCGEPSVHRAVHQRRRNAEHQDRSERRQRFDDQQYRGYRQHHQKLPQYRQQADEESGGEALNALNRGPYHFRAVALKVEDIRRVQIPGQQPPAQPDVRCEDIADLPARQEYQDHALDDKDADEFDAYRNQHLLRLMDVEKGEQRPGGRNLVYELRFLQYGDERHDETDADGLEHGAEGHAAKQEATLNPFAAGENVPKFPDKLHASIPARHDCS